MFEVHRSAGARLVPFAGFAMPLQFSGILAEHRATRQAAGLFDVSHMGQLSVDGRTRDAAARWLERLTPSNIAGLADGAMRYTVLTNEAGGIVDDLIVTRLGERFHLVVNGSRRAAVAAHMARHADPDVTVTALDRVLIALQGPGAEAALAPFVDLDLGAMAFMTAAEDEAFGTPALIARCGYTGEDGFELSLRPDAALAAWQALTEGGHATPVGLGARDTLRLEAGLCLYGQDLTEETSPVEADLSFAIGRRRREEGGFLGAGRVLAELADGPARRRVGLVGGGRVPARAGAPLTTVDGTSVGSVTSGGIGPTAGGPIAMAYVATEHAAAGTELVAEVRGKPVAVTVTPLPFVPPNTKRRSPR